MQIKKTQLQHLDSLIACHKSAFPNAISSKLGTHFTKKMFEWYILDKRGSLIHLEDNNENIIGYCGGILTTTNTQEGAFTSITQYAFGTFVISYLKKPWLCFHPETMKKFSSIKRNILKKVKRSKKQVKDENVHSFEPFFGLIVIGLVVEAQGKGYGQLLLKEFEKIGKENKFKKLSLSVLSSNKSAIQAYKKSGWIVENENTNDLTMIKYL